MLETLASETDAESSETTTVATLASLLDAERVVVESHLSELETCDLARSTEKGLVRVTITGEELLELDPDDLVIVDPAR